MSMTCPGLFDMWVLRVRHCIGWGWGGFIQNSSMVFGCLQGKPASRMLERAFPILVTVVGMKCLIITISVIQVLAVADDVEEACLHDLN